MHACVLVYMCRFNHHGNHTVHVYMYVDRIRESECNCTTHAHKKPHLNVSRVLSTGGVGAKTSRQIYTH